QAAPPTSNPCRMSFSRYAPILPTASWSTSARRPTKGQVNPDLRVAEDAVVQINIVNGDGALHDFSIPDFSVKSDQIGGKGAATAIVFRASKNGVYEYLCTLPGHKAAGMFGKLI